MLSDFTKTAESVVVTKDTITKIQEESKTEIEKFKAEELPVLVNKEIEKADVMKRNEALRFRYPQVYNDNKNADWKPGADVPFSILRRMAVVYPIARACINRRKSQIVQLAWDITTTDDIEDEAGYEAQIEAVKQLFKQPLGHKTRMREMLNIMVDDVLTVDAVCFEMAKTRGGEFMNLIPIDPTTIALRVTETGATPEPPEVAYAQFIAGKKIAEFTTDELIYEMMGSRSYSPYGLAPLESLILQTEAALRGTLYNLNYFRESNVPEGFITLPEEVASTQQSVQEWQDWFDLLIAGNSKMSRRLKILPGGAVYTAAKKPEDMAFERFELWMLQQTCAVFDVPPQDIGITYQVNKATGEQQAQLSNERGLFPLANFLKEILDDIIQVELGFDKLQFQWTNINPRDRKEDVEIAEKEVKMGALSVDEYRMETGREPIGLGHYVDTPSGPLLLDYILHPETNPANQQEEQKDKMEEKDIKAWRKVIYRQIEDKKPLKRNFQSGFIKAETHKAISEALEHISTKFQAKILFDQFLDPELKASVRLLQASARLRKLEEDADYPTN